MFIELIVYLQIPAIDYAYRILLELPLDLEALDINLHSLFVNTTLVAMLS